MLIDWDASGVATRTWADVMAAYGDIKTGVTKERWFRAMTQSAFDRLFPTGGQAFLLGQNRLFAFPLQPQRSAPNLLAGFAPLLRVNEAH